MTLRAPRRLATLSRFHQFFSYLLIGFLSAHAATSHALASGTIPSPGRPKLIVSIAIDGLPQRQVLNYRDQLSPDGFSRFLLRGSWFANAHYDHAYTVTAAGHAAMLTGAYPHRNGIIGNEWRDSQTGQSEYCTGDTSAHYIGHATRPLDGTSPKNLKVETVGDVLRGANPQSKVIAISGKDRGAILPAGMTGTAYTRVELLSGSRAHAPFFSQMQNAWHPDVSGDVHTPSRPTGSLACAPMAQPTAHPTPMTPMCPSCSTAPHG